MLKDDGIDAMGGPLYSKYERVRVETVWRQRLSKEAEVRANAIASRPKGVSAFQMNLANREGSCGLLGKKHCHNRIEIVTEKEHKQSPEARRSIKGMDPDSFEVQAIKHLEKKPADKWDLPMASSHDVGWLLAHPVRADTLRPPRQRGKFGGSSSMNSTAPGALPRSSSLPTNDFVLERSRSAPHLATGPHHPHLAHLNNRAWHRPKVQCDVTTYANQYVTLLHHNPFNQTAVGR